MKRLLLLFIVLFSVNAYAGELNSSVATSAATAATATALAANGGNCTAGNYPLGVDTLGAVETCTADDDIPEGADLTNAPKAKHFTIEAPGATENIIAFITDKAITVTQVSSVCLGTTPSVTWQFAHGTDITAAADLFTADKTTTSVTTIETDTATFNDATIAANEAVLFQTAAASGTISNCNFTIFYTVD